MTNGGATRTVQVTGPANGKGATIKGLEVGYQRFIDFLPGILSGLGFQGNLTFVKNTGVPNANLSPVGTLRREHSAAELPTLAMPERRSARVRSRACRSAPTISSACTRKGKVSARLAYNWRSKYLVTAVDCCVYLPVWQEALASSMRSIRYRLNEAIELSLEGSNLLNTKTKLLTQVTDVNSPEA